MVVLAGWKQYAEAQPLVPLATIETLALAADPGMTETAPLRMPATIDAMPARAATLLALILFLPACSSWSTLQQIHKVRDEVTQAGGWVGRGCGPQPYGWKETRRPADVTDQRSLHGLMSPSRVSRMSTSRST